MIVAERHVYIDKVTVCINLRRLGCFETVIEVLYLCFQLLLRFHLFHFSCQLLYISVHLFLCLPRLQLLCLSLFSLLPHANTLVEHSSHVD